MHSDSQPGQQYIIDVEVVNGGIPYADSFYVNVHYYLSRYVRLPLFVMNFHVGYASKIKASTPIK